MRFRLCPVLLLCLCLALLAPHAGAVVKIMPLGDSITRGGPETGTPFASYRYYLDESLRASGHGVDFVGSVSSGYTGFIFDQQHEGHGGYTTGMMVGSPSFSPLAAWLAASPTPDIVLLHIGTNDALAGVPIATRLANVKSIIGLLRQKNPRVRVMVAQIIPTANATLNLNAGLLEYNRALPPLAAGVSTASSPVTVVDLFAGYDGAADNRPDGVHPRASGERKMAAAWQRALAPILSTVPPAPTPAPTTRPATPAPTWPVYVVPGTLEGENYNPGGEGVGYHDTTAGNQGGAYRSDGVDVEALPGGGYAVGYVRDGEWLKYTVTVASAGQYRAAFRVAAWGSGSHAVEVSVNNNPAATVAVPVTGSYDAWTTATATLSLPAGPSTLRFRFVGDGQNLDRVVFTAATTSTPTTRPPTVAPTTAQTTPKANAVPGTLEAEDAVGGGEGVGYHDTTAGNQGGAYRSDDVDVEVLPGGGHAVAYVRDGEWLRYPVSAVSAGQYRAAFRVAAWGSGSHAVEVSVNNNPAVTVAVPTTGSYDAWTTITATLSLPAGPSTLKFRFVGDGQNLDRVAFTLAAPTAMPTTIATTAAPAGWPVPGTLEAEDYNPGGEGVGYHDTTAGNQGGAYRSDGIDVEALPGGGYAVGYVRDGEWLKYTVTVASAGQYRAAFRVAAWGSGSHAVEVSVNNNPAATVAVPVTGSYDAWTTATATLSLPAGTSTLKFRFVGDGQNLDRASFTAVAAPTAAPTAVQTTLGGIIRLPAQIQAENYAAGGEGVGYHDTTTGNQGGSYRTDGVDIAYAPSIGSYVVTRVCPGEWLEYPVEASEERDYSLTFRVSSPMGGRSFQLKVDGRSEVTVMTPRTGSYDAYTVISTQVRLTRGTHRLRVQFSGEGQNLDALGLA